MALSSLAWSDFGDYFTVSKRTNCTEHDAAKGGLTLMLTHIPIVILGSLHHNAVIAFVVVDVDIHR